jgi:hypothetical protein
VNGCRFREDVGFEGKCNSCVEWWPITDEFWYPRQGMSRCRACINVSQRRGARRKRAMDAALAAEARRKYRREWEAARRARIREAEGRRPYERRRAA